MVAERWWGGWGGGGTLLDLGLIIPIAENHDENKTQKKKLTEVASTDGELGQHKVGRKRDGNHGTTTEPDGHTFGEGAR